MADYIIIIGIALLIGVNATIRLFELMQEKQRIRILKDTLSVLTDISIENKKTSNEMLDIIAKLKGVNNG